MLKDVRHVPDMCLNLISAGKLDDVGLVNHFGGGMRKLTNESIIVAKGKKGRILILYARKVVQAGA